MLPSSSSQLARYGQINHCKKFWLLQTQLEKQEQSASSSLSLGNTNMSASVANNIAASPLVALSGDHHLVGNIAASPYGTCRADTQAAPGTNCSGRVHSGSTFSYCPAGHEPACSSSSYSLHTPGYRADVLRGNDGPRLSLAVNCGNVSDSREYESSESSEVEKRVCNTTASQVSWTSSAIQLRIRDQLHRITEFQSRNIVHLSHSTYPLSAPLSSIGNLRTCSLCGTTKTPLWRSGPDGPKSLCNACGIRVKKTKKLEAALQATRGGSPSPSPSAMSPYKGALKRKLTSESRKEATFHKKKRSTSMHMSSMIDKQGLSCNGGIWDNGSPKLLQGVPAESGRRCGNMCAKDVEEAAVLLMALSCGLVLS